MEFITVKMQMLSYYLSIYMHWIFTHTLDRVNQPSRRNQSRGGVQRGKSPAGAKTRPFNCTYPFSFLSLYFIPQRFVIFSNGWTMSIQSWFEIQDYSSTQNVKQHFNFNATLDTTIKRFSFSAGNFSGRRIVMVRFRLEASTRILIREE